MRIAISEHNGQPIYQQIIDQVRRLVCAGRLRPDDELPSIRALAEQLVINPNTVARAYRELELTGIVAKKRATGCFISQQAGEIAKKDRFEMLTPKVDELVDEAAQLELTEHELIAFISTRLRAKRKD